MNIFIMSRPSPGPARPGPARPGQARPAHTRPRPGPSPMCLNCFQPRPGPGPQYVGPGPARPGPGLDPKPGPRRALNAIRNEYPDTPPHPLSVTYFMSDP